MNGISIVSDTNPLIYLLNGSKKAAEYLNDKQVWISAFSEVVNLHLQSFITSWYFHVNSQFKIDGTFLFNSPICTGYLCQ